MLTFDGLNWLAIIVAAVVYFVVAAIWYQPRVMGKKWMESVGMESVEEGPNPAIFLVPLISYFIMATVLAMIARGIGAESFTDGLVLGLLTGFVFVAMQSLINASFEGRSMNLVLVNGGLGIIGHALAAIIVTTWV